MHYLTVQIHIGYYASLFSTVTFILKICNLQVVSSTRSNNATCRKSTEILTQRGVKTGSTRTQNWLERTEFHCRYNHGYLRFTIPQSRLSYKLLIVQEMQEISRNRSKIGAWDHHAGSWPVRYSIPGSSDRDRMIRRTLVDPGPGLMPLTTKIGSPSLASLFWKTWW